MSTAGQAESTGRSLDRHAALAACLANQGFAHVTDRLRSRQEAWAFALSLATRVQGTSSGGCGQSTLEIVGEFNLPPEHAEQRDFQALHVDFGVPRLTARTVDVALYTALYIDDCRDASGAATRLVPLNQLLRQRCWPEPAIIAERLCATTRDGSAAEGILARVVESLDETWDLPAKQDDFLCGMEFDSVDDERRYFQRHGLDIDSALQTVTLSRGELLVFDNLAIAHGRQDRRPPRELHQLCLGVKSIGLAQQAEILKALASRFSIAA